jgi:hypothetical protein
METQKLWRQASLTALAAGMAAGTCTAGMAQTAGFGTISGTVQDVSHASIAGAKVRILDKDTGAERDTTTTGAGTYLVDFLTPGHYEVIVSSPGFATVDRKSVTLQVGQVLGIDVQLPAGEVSTNVEVNAASPVLDTEKTDASQNINEHFVANLPVNGRRYDNFVLLTPNVVPDGDSGLISYRGVSGIYNSNLIDGANNNQAFFSEARGRSTGAPYVYSLDSISEFQTETSAYSPEFGQAAGGVINAVTRSGTNQMHGDLFYYLRYPALNALDPYSKSQYFLTQNPLLLTQPVHQQQQFGGSVGGPILKDKLFYFFTYDGFRRVNPIFYTSTTPEATILGFNCNATVPNGGIQVTAQQCTAAKNYVLGLEGSFPRNTKQDIFFPKLDWQINQNNHVSVDFNWENFQLPNGYNSATSVTNSSVTQNGEANFHERFLIANLNSVLSAHSDNEVRFAFSRDLETDTTNSPGPAVSLTGITAYGETSALPRGAFPDEHRWQAEDVYTTTLGKHTIKAGVDLNFIHEQLSNLFQGDGSYGYSTGTPANIFANWVQDVYGLNGGQHYTSFTQVNDPITHVGADDFWNKDLAAFAADSWRVTPTFLVNAGVRYDTQLVPQPDRPNTTSAVAQLYTSTINTDYHMFQPRVGFSWQPLPTTVIRGGYGLVFGLTSNSTFYTIRRENGVYQQQYTTKTETPGSNTYESWAPHAPNTLFTPPGPAQAAPFAGAAVSQTVNTNPPLATIAARGLDPKFENPYSDSFDLAVEQQLPMRTSLTIQYVGNRAMRLPIFVDTNLEPASTTREYDIVSAQGVTQKQVTLPFYAATGTTKGRVSASTGSLLTGFSDVNSWYNSMAVTVNKRLDHGLQLLVNYTWSKAIDGGQVSGVNGTFNGTDVPVDPMDRKAEYARSDLDLRNRFVASLVYTPEFHLADRYARIAANGWTVSGTATEQTGFPVTPFLSNSPTGGVDGGLTGGDLSLNNSPTGGRAPFFSRNAFPGPGLRNIDARVGRTVAIHGPVRMEFFAEAFNLANHQNRLSVNTTAYTWTAASATSTTCSSAVHGAGGCIVPYASLPFGATTSTSSILYGPRQLQFTAKLFF